MVEAFPVYSVHQHAMAPMVLLDLLEAGGNDHRAEVAAGLAWLDEHPEVSEELISDEAGLVWRKVGRRSRARRPEPWPPPRPAYVGAGTCRVSTC